MPGRFIYHDVAQIVDCRRQPQILFVFGDNMLGFGRAGQACIRGEANAFGIPTKRAPGHAPVDYFSDKDAAPETPARRRIDAEFTTLLAALRGGATVSFPRAGIGTGLAQLPQRAPAVAALIAEWVERLREETQKA